MAPHRLLRRQAEVAQQYLRKGSPVYVEGRLRTRRYTDKDGIERYATEIVSESMQLLPSGRSQSSGSQMQRDDSFETNYVPPQPRQQAAAHAPQPAAHPAAERLEHHGRYPERRRHSVLVDSL